MVNDKIVNKKVLLGMSGGIDSTVSAMLLLEQGYEVVGVTFRTYDSIKESCLAREKGCCSIESIMEAKHNAERMGFEHHIVDFRETFKDCVIRNFIDEYMAGRTPNPCVLCNSHIKWGELLRVADELGCAYVATGHYAQIRERNGHLFLANAVDTKKDQTYFLWMLTEENLRRTIFPLGGRTKDEVRAIAREHGYETLAEKKESQEICFIPNDDYRSFLRENVPDFDTKVQPGSFLLTQTLNDQISDKIVNDQIVNKFHSGFANYTVGQRKGLGIALGQPAYVTHIDAARNEVTLGTNEDMYASSLRFELKTPLRPFRTDMPLTAKIRYRTTPVEVQLRIDEQQKTGEVFFSSPVWGVTPGQSLVLYQENLVIGGGVIIS